MSDKTRIEWTAGTNGEPGATWNPSRGCSRVSDGCRNCYAERIAARFSGPGQPYEGFALLGPDRKAFLDSLSPRRDGKSRGGTTGARWTGRVELIPSQLDLPLRWRKPRRVFVDSMSDLFHEKLSNEGIAAVFGVMAACPQHTFQVLTKRAERMREWFAWVAREHVTHPEGIDGVHVVAAEEAGVEGRLLASARRDWPLPWAWLGVSVEDQATADERIPHLLATPAAVHWISLEPQLESVDLAPWIGRRAMDRVHGAPANVGVDWVVQGGESGTGARPFNLAWARSTIAQCKAAGTAYFGKQLGARPVNGSEERGTWPVGLDHFALRDRKGGDMEEWPSDLRVREFPVGRCKET